MPLNDQNPGYWFELAKHDIDSAKVLRRENGFSDIIVYHLHQGIEKLLKGLIIVHGETFPYIHDLERLFKILCGQDPRYADLMEPVITLQSFYKNLRYPQSDFLLSSDTEKALSAFVQIISKLKLLSTEIARTIVW
jgi:HEPN domain-containing protein